MTSNHRLRDHATGFHLLFFLLFFIPAMQAQDIPLGQWRHHLPNNRIIAIIETPDRIIGASPYGLAVFNKADNSLEKINKVHGLSDFGITALTHSPTRDLVILGYENGNLDIIRNNTQFINVPDIRRANILGSKKVNNILIREQRAYLSCGFGIVVLDLNTLLILDTYFIGPQGSQVEVFDMVNTHTHFYAATNAGLLRAPLQGVNLADYRNWVRQTVSGQANETFNHLEIFNGKIFANRDAGNSDILYVLDDAWQIFDPEGNGYTQKRRNIMTSAGNLLISNDLFLDVYNQDLTLKERIDTYYDGPVRAFDALFDSNGQLWVADQYYGMARRIAPTSFQLIVLSGPFTANAFGLATSAGRLWVAPGAISIAGANSWNQDGVFLFDEGRWYNFNRFQFPQMDNVGDIIRIATHPGNPDRAFAASWTQGVLEFSPQGAVVLYDDSNSPLKRRFGVGDFIRVSGVKVDRRGNLWMANSQVERPLVVKKDNGDWLSFPNGGVISSTQLLGNIEIDRQDQKWVILPLNNGIYLFKENSLDTDNDFQARRLTTQENNGGLPSNNVLSLATDHDGYMWVGTDQGIAVFYSPQRAFSGDPFNAQQIIVEQDGFAAVLLGTESVTAIQVDGSNKKWVGTSRSGAFLLSADGRQTIYHFNASNSPLPSDNILDIAVNGLNGEVFFATDKGLVSFRGMATQAGSTHSEVYAFPNPVRPHYHGPIAIKGLVTNAWVKVTDIAGNLVYETVAEGGQAVWNGRDLFGRRPATGVYLVFSTNEDGSETMVTKILFIH